MCTRVGYTNRDKSNHLLSRLHVMQIMQDAKTNVSPCQILIMTNDDDDIKKYAPFI